MLKLPRHKLSARIRRFRASHLRRTLTAQVIAATWDEAFDRGREHERKHPVGAPS